MDMARVPWQATQPAAERTAPARWWPARAGPPKRPRLSPATAATTLLNNNCNSKTLIYTQPPPLPPGLLAPWAAPSAHRPSSDPPRLPSSSLAPFASSSRCGFSYPPSTDFPPFTPLTSHTEGTAHFDIGSNWHGNSGSVIDVCYRVLEEWKVFAAQQPSCASRSSKHGEPVTPPLQIATCD